VLKKACNIYEPNDPEFTRITHRVYEVVNEAKDYDYLYSTRFFGTMVFYLTWYKKLDNLIGAMIHNANLDDCVDCIRLFLILHADTAKSVSMINEKTPPEEMIEVNGTFCL
jgi:small subunit ribosomal protein S22